MVRRDPDQTVEGFMQSFIREVRRIFLADRTDVSPADKVLALNRIAFEIMLEARRGKVVA